MSTQEEIWSRHDEYLTSPPPESNNTKTWSIHELDCYQNDEGDWITESIGEATEYLTINDDMSDPDIARTVMGSNPKYLELLTNRPIDLTREDDVIWIDDPNSGENLLQLHKEG